MRVADDEDQRKSLISLSSEGERILAMALPLREQAQVQMINRMGSEDVAKAIELLTKMATAAQDQ